MPISVLLQQILIIFLEIGIGAVAAKCNVISSEGSKVLSNLVMYITLPCTLLASTNISGGADTVCPPETLERLWERLPDTKLHLFLNERGHGHNREFSALMLGFAALYA